LKLSEYKEQGILEAYVLRVLPPEMEDQLLADLETNVALRNELNKVEQSLSNFKENFTRSPTDKEPSPKKRKSKSRPSPGQKREKSIRIIVGILTIVVVAMIFLYLSTLYEKTAYQSQLIHTERTLDTLNQNQMEAEELIAQLESGLIASLDELSGEWAAVGLNGIQARLIPLQTKGSELLVINRLAERGPGEFLQLWSRQNDQYRKMGTVNHWKEGPEGYATVSVLPATNLQLSLISIESDPVPAQPREENILLEFRR